MLTIRVSDEEHARLLERCEGKRLAEWMRRGCLGGAGARTGKMPTLSPPLLRHLAAIGDKLNQTAREGKSGHRASIDRGHVGGAPMGIEGGLRQVRQGVRGKGGGGD
ncbi:mobilization protein, partial [Salmonella enterica]|uniref:mobilization protein n=1 Tax=Salmonella enterica TaxID=28901 RepID=UPI00082785C7